MYFFKSYSKMQALFKYTNRINYEIIRKIHNESSLRSRLPRVGFIGNQLSNTIKPIGDNVPEGFQLIYRAPMQNYLSAAKNITALSAAIMSALVAYQFGTSGKAVPNIQPELEYGKLVAHEEDLKYFALGFIGISLAMHTIVAKYPLRIYKNAENYIAFYSSRVPLGGLREFRFKRGDVSEAQSRFNPWSDIYYRIGDRKSFLFARYFRTPAEFNEMFTKS